MTPESIWVEIQRLEKAAKDLEHDSDLVFEELKKSVQEDMGRLKRRVVDLGQNIRQGTESGPTATPYNGLIDLVNREIELQKEIIELANKENTAINSNLRVLRDSENERWAETHQKVKDETNALALKDRERIKLQRHRLLPLGFAKRAYQELQVMALINISSSSLQKAAAWELAVWHANKYTPDDAQACLDYLSIVGEEGIFEYSASHVAVLKAECYDLLGDTENAKAAIDHVLSKDADSNILLAAANLEENAVQQMSFINEIFRSQEMSEVALSKSIKGHKYDRLSPGAQQAPVAHLDSFSHKVTVIIPSYNAAGTIGTTIRSLLSQTWVNLEILVVDDCSSDRTAAIVRDFQLQDPRVHLLRTPQNDGPYVARNVGLLAATGEFVTCNDSDDWSHPEKIERQVTHLMENPDVVANISKWARITNNLKAFRRGNPGFYIQLNLSSLMFRRKVVMQKLGFWDSVRFGADSEFYKRIQRDFGQNALVEIPLLLSLARSSETSLTENKKFGYPGFPMGARREYAESSSFYHRSDKKLKYSFPMEERPFPVPEAMLSVRHKTIPHLSHIKFDIAFVCDFRIEESNIISSVVEELNSFKSAGLRCALVQMNLYNIEKRTQINPIIRSMIDGDLIQMVVYGETILSGITVIPYPAVLMDEQTYIPEINSNAVVVVLGTAPSRIKNSLFSFDLIRCNKILKQYFNKEALWFPVSAGVRKLLYARHKKELKSIVLAPHDWSNVREIWGQYQFDTYFQKWKKPSAAVNDQAALDGADTLLHRHLTKESIDQLKREYSDKGLDEIADTFILYRIIGNDLYPRHKKGQSRDNLRFILENEPDLENCEKRFILNRIIDPVEENAIIDLLNEYNYQFKRIPFDPQEFKMIDFDLQSFKNPSLIATGEFTRFNVFKKYRALVGAYRLKNNYVMNNNGARNVALNDGKTASKWILPWDGNCYLTAQAWKEIQLNIKRAPYIKYFIVPMARVLNNRELLTDSFSPNATDEPQIIFRSDSAESFNEMFWYGRRPKVELFWRLKVPGKWNEWKDDDPWDPERSPVSSEAKQFAFVGWVARLFSGMGELEKEEHAGQRVLARNEAILSALNYVSAKTAGASPDLLLLSDQKVLDQEQEIFQNQSDPVLDALIKNLIESAHRCPHPTLSSKEPDQLFTSVRILTLTGKIAGLKKYEEWAARSLDGLPGETAADQAVAGPQKVYRSEELLGAVYFVDCVQMLKAEGWISTKTWNKLQLWLRQVLNDLLHTEAGASDMISGDYKAVAHDLAVLSFAHLVGDIDLVYGAILRAESRMTIQGTDDYVMSQLLGPQESQCKALQLWSMLSIAALKYGTDLVSDTPNRRGIVGIVREWIKSAEMVTGTEAMQCVQPLEVFGAKVAIAAEKLYAMDPSFPYNTGIAPFWNLGMTYPSNQS